MLDRGKEMESPWEYQHPNKFIEFEDCGTDRGNIKTFGRTLLSFEPRIMPLDTTLQELRRYFTLNLEMQHLHEGSIVHATVISRLLSV